MLKHMREQWGHMYQPLSATWKLESQQLLKSVLSDFSSSIGFHIYFVPNSGICHSEKSRNYGGAETKWPRPVSCVG